MRIVIRAEIGCDENGRPTHHEESIDCIDIWPSNMSIIRIHIVEGILHIDLKEDFDAKYITSEEGIMCFLKKSDHIPSKRVGKRALYRCFNCKNADECKYLVRDSVMFRH